MINCEFEHGRKASLRHVTVDALVVKDSKVLMVKRASDLSEGGKYSLPGGFMDRDETTKEAVVREVREETGYNSLVKGLVFINDNPTRGTEDRQNVTFLYLMELLNKVGEPDNEVQNIKWFDINDISKEKTAFDHYDLIKYYSDNKDKDFGNISIGS